LSTNLELIRDLASELKIDQVGVISSDPLYYMLPRLHRRIDEKRITPFEETKPAGRISPDLLLNNCQSIIVLALPYTAASQGIPETADAPRGIVARCARSIDYHILLECKASELAQNLKTYSPEAFNYKVLCDRSPLLERELAFRSGLGLIGENCTLINHRYGSYVTLGTILVDKKIEPPGQFPLKKHCLRCGKCRKACPTGAISEPYILNPHLCLSYLTQAPGVFPRELRPRLGGRIYGCDSCQDACPLNKNTASSPHPEVAFSFFPAEPLLIPVINMTQKEFKLTIEKTSAGWRGKTTIQRNAVIALGNNGDKTAVKELAKLLENDPRAVIRLHAAWALGRLSGKKARRALDKSRLNDPETMVKNEAELALDEQDTGIL